MASTDSKPVPQKNVAYRHYFDIRKNDGTLITTWAGMDSEVSKDGGSFTDCTNEATEIGTSGCGYIDLTSTEMNADHVYLKITVTNTSALPVTVPLYPEEAGDIRVNTTAISGTAQTARDIGASVLISSGTGTGQLSVSSGVIKADIETIKTQTVTCAAGVTVNANVGTTQPIKFTAYGADYVVWTDMKIIQGDETQAMGLANAGGNYNDFSAFQADVAKIKGYALTETSAGYLAASFSEMHDVAAPVFTTASVNQTGNSYGIVNDGTNGNAAIVTKLGSMSGATFDTATDSLEAIRNRGDAEWITGSGGSAPSAADIRAEMDTNSTKLAAIVADTNELQTDWVNGGRLDLILDARASQASVDDVPTVAEFEARTLVAANYFDPAADTVANVTTVGTTTNLTNLPTIPANWLTAAGLATDAVAEIQSGLASQSSIDTLTTYVDTEVAAIKAKTDNLPASPAATGDIPSAATIADAVLDEATAGHTTAGTLGKAVIDTLADTNELQTNQGNWLTATGFATPTNVSDAQTAIIAQVDANETKIDALTTTVGANGIGLTDLPWNAAWNAEVQSEVADALYASPPVDGSGVGIYSVAYAALALTHSNRSSATTLLVKSANGTTIGTHTLTEDDTLDPVSVVGDGS